MPYKLAVLQRRCNIADVSASLHLRNAFPLRLRDAFPLPLRRLTIQKAVPRAVDADFGQGHRWEAGAAAGGSGGYGLVPAIQGVKCAPLTDRGVVSVHDENAQNMLQGRLLPFMSKYSWGPFRKRNNVIVRQWSACRAKDGHGVDGSAHKLSEKNFFILLGTL
eukprot:1160237-Pelagomonas_calceolata.AAC.6